LWFILLWIFFAVIHKTEVKPEAGHHVTYVDNNENKTSKAAQVILSLLGIFLKSTMKQELEWLSQPVEMDDSESLKIVVLTRLIHE